MLSIVVILIMLIAIIFLTYDILFPALLVVAVFWISQEFFPEAAQTILEFAIISSNNWYNAAWMLLLAGLGWLSFTLCVQTYKYAKDCFYLGTNSFKKQWRCRKALQYRSACIKMLAIHLREDEYSIKVRQEMILFARMWEMLCTADILTGEFTAMNYPKTIPDDDYNDKWITTLNLCRASDLFNTAVDIYEMKDKSGLYAKYGYHI